MHPAAEACEVILRVLALAVARETIPCSGCGVAAPRPFVAGIGPEPCCLGLAGAGDEHADGQCRKVSGSSMTFDMPLFSGSWGEARGVIEFKGVHYPKSVILY